MDKIDVFNVIAKNFCINLLIYWVFVQVTNYKNNGVAKIFGITVVSIINAITYCYLIKYINKVFTILFIYWLFGIYISKITKNDVKYTIIAVFISVVITYSISIISMIIGSIVLRLLISNITVNNIIGLIIIILLDVILINLLFKIKRFKNGFSFLSNNKKLDNIGIIGMFLISFAIFTYAVLEKCYNELICTVLVIILIVEFICMIIWIKRKITKFYKQKLKEQTIESLENEIKEKDKLISKISEENKVIATINHKYSNRINALEKFSNKILTLPELSEKLNTEFGEEFLEFKKQVKEISKEYSKEVEEKLQHENITTKTGIFGIDNLLEYMNSEAIKSNINFNVKINENINELIETEIPQNKLETLLGDHIKDAIIAINSSESKEKEIDLEITKSKNIYEIIIADTGVNFEIETLIKLGKEQTTTHLATGGSGIGFMTTFQTLNETSASLEIEELQNGKYTKIIKIIFDNKNEYRIKTYRKEEIAKQNNEKRIILM